MERYFSLSVPQFSRNWGSGGGKLRGEEAQKELRLLGREKPLENRGEREENSICFKSEFI